MATQADTKTGQETLFIPGLGAHKIMASDEKGGSLKVLRVDQKKNPDSVGIDVANGRVYFTNMGVAPRRMTGPSKTTLSRTFLWAVSRKLSAWRQTG